MPKRRKPERAGKEKNKGVWITDFHTILASQGKSPVFVLKRLVLSVKNNGNGYIIFSTFAT